MKVSAAESQAWRVLLLVALALALALSPVCSGEVGIPELSSRVQHMVRESCRVFVLDLHRSFVGSGVPRKDHKGQLELATTR